MEKVKSENKSKSRESNIELLRIVAMLLIVAHHFAMHSGFNFNEEIITVNRLWIQFIEIGGKLGVNIFILISGYFLIDSTERKTSKVIKLWIQIFTYSILTLTIYSIIGRNPVGLKEIIKSILPITFREMWFASSYFVLYLISPYINGFLKSMDKKTYQRMIALLTICWCIIPTFSNKDFESNDLIWLIYLYSIAGYIRMYVPKNKIKGKKSIALSIIIIILTYLSVILFDILGMRSSFFASNTTYFYEMKKLPMVLTAIFIFVGFLKLNIGHNKFINNIAGTTFGIYLLHDNKYIRPLLWKKTFKAELYINSSNLILCSITIIVIVFIGCSIIEWLRIHIFEKRYMKTIDKLSSFVDRWVEKIFLLKCFDK